MVVGGAPCQGFSMIGKRALDDPRNQLIRHFLRLVVEIQPAAFVLENVRGLTLGKHRRFLDEIVREFAAHSHRVRLPWQVLNASDFGVPQHRQRLFLIGARNDAVLPEYPLLNLGCVPPTCHDALGDLPDADEFDQLIAGDSARVGGERPLSAYAREMQCLNSDTWHYGYVRDWDPSLLTSSMRTAHTEISKRRFEQTPPGTVEPISRFFKLAEVGLSNTLRAGTDSARGAFTSPRPIHYKFNRCVTVREMARLHGFPDWFRLHVTKWHGARQIGNAVPPPLARALASNILRSWSIDPVRPITSVQLGDEGLLKMNMTEASAYWGVEIPIGRRDRKSGDRKRIRCPMPHPRSF